MKQEKKIEVTHGPAKWNWAHGHECGLETVAIGFLQSIPSRT